MRKSVKFTSNRYDEMPPIGQSIKELRCEIKHLTKTNQDLRPENKRLTLRIKEQE